jgi:hypothetical protein
MDNPGCYLHWHGLLVHRNYILQQLHTGLPARGQTRCGLDAFFRSDSVSVDGSLYRQNYSTA